MSLEPCGCIAVEQIPRGLSNTSDDDKPHNANAKVFVSNGCVGVGWVFRESAVGILAFALLGLSSAVIRHGLSARLSLETYNRALTYPVCTRMAKYRHDEPLWRAYFAVSERMAKLVRKDSTPPRKPHVATIIVARFPGVTKVL